MKLEEDSRARKDCLVLIFYESRICFFFFFFLKKIFLTIILLLCTIN